MSDTRKFILLISGAVIFFLLMTSVFIVKENEQVLVLRFGNPQNSILKPGMHFKLSFIDNLKVYEKRILNVDPPAEQVLLADQKRLVVDTFARYRITNMLQFFQAVGTETAAEQRLYAIINSAARSSLGRATLADVLSAKRNTLMRNILKDVNAQTERMGIQVVDVRIVRAELPEQVTQSTFARMRSEREREAREARAEGAQLSTEIKSTAEKERSIILAEAQKDAQILRGKGDNEAITIYSKAFGQDPQFYAFYRSLEAYRASLSDPETTMVLTPDSEFFRFFKGKLPTQ
jgi:membrane protease subunit HflC